MKMIIKLNRAKDKAEKAKHMYEESFKETN